MHAPQFRKHTVAIVGTAGVPAQYGGFETLAACLCEQFEISGPRVAVYCSGPHYPDRRETYHGAELRYVPLRANGWQSMIYDAASMLHAVAHGTDTILLLGVSGAFLLPFLRLVSSVHIVTNVDGIESRREKWGWLARRLLRGLEWLAIRFSHVVIADNAGIQEYLARTYRKSVDVIAYGGDHVAPDGAEPHPAVDGPYALVIARVEPENNIEMILDAFDTALVKGRALVAIGNWDASEYGRSLKQRFSTRPGYSLRDPIYDRERVRSFRAHANIYIHGHSAGGTNPSLVEAMFFPVPIVAYDCTFNRFTLAGRGGYFSTAGDLAEVLARLLVTAVDGDVDAVMRLARERYTWGHIAAEYATALQPRFSRSRTER